MTWRRGATTTTRDRLSLKASLEKLTDRYMSKLPKRSMTHKEKYKRQRLRTASNVARRRAKHKALHPNDKQSHKL